MAQTGYTPISLYYSTTASAVPDAGNLVAGELAINTLDEKLYFKNSSGVVTLLASSSGSSGDVAGPASSTDKAIATFDGITGKLIQNNSGVTITSGVITATSFSGPLNGTVGATTPNTGAFTTLSSTGNTTLGDASDDTLTINASLGTVTNGLTLSRSITDTSGSPINASYIIFNDAVGASTATLFGIVGDAVQNSASSVTALRGGFFRVRVENTGTILAASCGLARLDVNAAATVADFSGFDTSITFDAAATATTLRQYGAGIVANAGGATLTTHSVFATGAQTVGTNIYGFRGQINAAANRYNVYADGTAENYFAGNVGIGTSSPYAPLEVKNSSANTTIGGSSSVIKINNSSGTLNATSGIEFFHGNDTSSNAARVAGVYGQYASYNVSGIGGNLIFATNTAGDATIDERMRIDSSGDISFTGATIMQNSRSAAYTLVAADANKHILHPSADTTARTFTIPANSSVAYSIGTALTFVNQNGAGVVTIAINTDTMRLAGAGTTGSRTLDANGIATALKITATEWIISGTGLT